jgi:hypothetical protein
MSPFLPSADIPVHASDVCFRRGFENVEIFETDEKAPKHHPGAARSARGMVPASLRPFGGGEGACRQHAPGDGLVAN